MVTIPGITQTMNTAIKNAGLPDPIYEEIESSFVVTFRKAEAKDHGTLNGTLSGTLNGTLNEALQTFYTAIQKHPGA